MMGTPNEATILISAVDHAEEAHPEGWKFKSQHDLLSDIEELIKTKSIGGSIMYVILMLLAMLAIFDTQVLSIFRRQREIGTFVALGMTRGEVVRMFTVEGAMHAVLAMIVGAIYGIPLFWFMATKGIAFPARLRDCPCRRHLSSLQPDADYRNFYNSAYHHSHCLVDSGT
jgi:ABC-type antimicrobial peptide transport system permease subunit